MVGVGTVVGGKYRLEAPVGEGGMATIWRAMHVDLDRAVAVKFIHSSQADRVKHNERFLREARVAAAIRHRNVVDILDFGAAAEGNDPYMVMELLVGQPLSDRLVHGPALTVADVVEIIAQTLSGLAAVHDAGIIHRDLKPENVFLVRDADGEFPKLLDFGVSRVVDPQLAGRKSVMPTHENLIVGTPHYMSPEQARGLRTIDQRTDVYSMGVILYELLTGAFPFDSENPGDLIVMIATQDPVRVSALRPDLGQPLSDLVAKAMARDPEQRFGSAREMRDALLTAAHDAGVKAMVPSYSTGRHRIPPPELAMVRDSSAMATSDAPLRRSRDNIVTEGEGATPRGWEIASARASEPGAVRKRRGPWIAAAALLLAGGGGAAAYASGVLDPVLGRTPPLPATAAPPPRVEAPEPAPAEPEPAPADPPESYTVELRGVPEGAVVQVDGAPATLPLVLPPDGRTHEIHVSLEGHVPWRMGHPADHDGSYEVSLEALPAAQAPAPTAGRRTARRRGGPRAGPDGVVRELDF